MKRMGGKKSQGKQQRYCTTFELIVSSCLKDVWQPGVLLYSKVAPKDLVSQKDSKSSSSDCPSANTEATLEYLSLLTSLFFCKGI